MVDAMAQFLATAEHHGGGGAQSQRMGHAVHLFPVVAGALQARNFPAHFIVENFRAAAGNGLQPGIHQALNRFADAEFAHFRDAQDWRWGKTMKMNLRIARLQRAQQIFVIADLQVRVQPTLEQNPGAAELQHFVDFFVDFLARKNVTVLGSEAPVKRGEGAILGAEIRVVDVAVDLVGDDARIVFLQAHLMSGHTDAHEVIGFEHFESLLFRQSQELASSVPKSRKSRFLAPLGMTTKSILQAPKISRPGAQPAATGATTTSRLPLLQWPTRWAWLAESSRVLRRPSRRAAP